MKRLASVVMVLTFLGLLSVTGCPRTPQPPPGKTNTDGKNDKDKTPAQINNGAVQPEEGKEAAALIQKLGGKFERDQAKAGKPITAVSFEDVTAFRDDELKQTVAELEKLKQLRKLNLSNTKITDAGLKELAPLEGLQELHLNYISISGRGLQALEPLKNLKNLSLKETALTGADLKAVASLKQLEYLDLSGIGGITSADVKELQKELPKVKIKK